MAVNKIKKKGIKEVCKEVDLIIDGKDNRIDHKYIFLHFNDALTRKISYDEIVLICETIIKISITKNRMLRHLEKDFWNFITRIPLQIIINQGLEIGENEELLSNSDYSIPGKKILSRVVGLVQDILELKDDHSKASDKRRAGSLRIIGELINYYNIPFAKKMFVNSIFSKNKEEQYEALQGLEDYYAISEDDIEDDLVEMLDVIKTETDDRSVASTCLQIQINAGIIDEMTALDEIDDWEEEHYD
jgi:hypothetical protein